MTEVWVRPELGHVKVASRSSGTTLDKTCGFRQGMWLCKQDCLDPEQLDLGLHLLAHFVPCRAFVVG
jgi:hypothetical protein